MSPVLTKSVAYNYIIVKMGFQEGIFVPYTGYERFIQYVVLSPK